MDDILRMPVRQRAGAFRSKLVLLVVITGAVTATLVTVMLLARSYMRALHSQVGFITGQAQAVAIHCVAPLRFDDPKAAEEVVDEDFDPDDVARLIGAEGPLPDDWEDLT